MKLQSVRQMTNFGQKKKVNSEMTQMLEWWRGTLSGYYVLVSILVYEYVNKIKKNML